MKANLGIALGLFACFVTTTAPAGDCTVAPAEGMPADISPEISRELDPHHVKLIGGEAGDLCEVWLTKSWNTNGQEGKPDDFAPILYRLHPGSLIGVMRIAKKCVDVRDTEVPAGTYILRYALQPDLDTHRDSHDSRDFLVLLPAGDDKSVEPITDEKRLIELGTAVTLTNHPAIIPLLKPGESDKPVALKRDEKDPDGWVLRVTGRDEKGEPVPLELLVFRPAPD